MAESFNSLWDSAHDTQMEGGFSVVLPPPKDSFWDICLNPFGNPVTHYFKRTLPSSDPCDIEQICRLCMDELLKREGYQPKKATPKTNPFVSTRGTESKPESNSL